MCASDGNSTISTNDGFIAGSVYELMCHSISRNQIQNRSRIEKKNAIKSISKLKKSWMQFDAHFY